jgi:tetratricopeptide (TPR) repeat protein
MKTSRLLVAAWSSAVAAGLVLPAGCEAPKPLRKPAAMWDQTRLSAMLQLADEQISTGKFDQARQTLATLHESADPRLAVALARVDVEEGRYEAALNRLDGVAEDARSGATYYRLRGVALEALGRWTDAATAYEAAYRAEPSIELLLAWLDALVLDERMDAARAVLEQERRRFPGQPVLQVLAARLCQRQGNNATALHELATAELAEPDSPEIRRRLADAYLAAGRYAEARQLYRALLVLKPDDDDAGLGVAASSLGVGEPDAALDAALRILARHSDNVDAQLVAALSYRRLNQPELAVPLLSALHGDETAQALARQWRASGK